MYPDPCARQYVQRIAAGLPNVRVDDPVLEVKRNRALSTESKIDERVHRGIQLSINGVAAGLRNTG